MELGIPSLNINLWNSYQLQQSSSRLVHHNNNTLICSPDLLLTVLDISQELCHSVFTI